MSKADRITLAKRRGAVDRQTVVALLLSLPIALVVVMAVSPFQDAARLEPEEEPPRPKLKAPAKGKKGETPPTAKSDSAPPRDATPQKGVTKPQEKK